MLPPNGFSPHPSFGPPAGDAPVPFESPAGQLFSGEPAQPAAPSSFLTAPPPARQGWPAAAKITVGIVGGVVAIAILAAVAVPVFFSQRKPPEVTLVLSNKLENSFKLTTPAARQAVQTLQSSLTSNLAFTSPQAAVYGRGTTPVFGILVAKLVHRGTATDTARFFEGAASGAGSTPLASVPAGPLGGKTECGISMTAGTQVLLCASIDQSAVVWVTVYNGDQTDDIALAQKLRVDVERH